MDINTKSQAINLGSAIDVESINRHISHIRKILAKSNPLIGKLPPLNANEYISEIAKMLSEQRKRRDDAALRLLPMRCGCHDPLRCRCYSKRGAR